MVRCIVNGAVVLSSHASRTSDRFVLSAWRRRESQVSGYPYCDAARVRTHRAFTAGSKDRVIMNCSFESINLKHILHFINLLLQCLLYV